MEAWENIDEKPKSVLSIQQMRLVELVSIFLIVFVAKEIAGFNYKNGIIVLILFSAAFVNIAVTGLENFLTRSKRWKEDIKERFDWLNILFDLAIVLAIIYLTGTAQSPFLFLVIIPLFFASRVVSPIHAGIFVTALTAATIGVLGSLELAGIIPHHNCYPFKDAIALNKNYLAGTLMVLVGFMSLMTYLFGSFYDNFRIYISRAEDKLMSSRKRIIELTRLYDISLGINSVISLDTLLKMVCKEITLLLRRSWASILLVNQKGEAVKYVEIGRSGVSSQGVDDNISDDPLFRKVLDEEDGFEIRNLDEHPEVASSFLVADRGLKGIIAIPISSGKENLGVMLVGEYEDVPFDQEDLRLMTILSSQVATAIEKSRLYEVMNSRISRLERENEKLKNANKLKMSYISHLSHEFKTPLTSIKAYAESLSDHMESMSEEERKGFIDVITSETNRLIRMVNKVLDISRIEFGQRTLRRKLFSLRELLSDVQNSMQPALDEKSLHLIVNLPDDLPLIDGDEDLIKQVFINLISNAIKHSPNNSRIFIEGAEDAVSVKVTVRDEGEGIPEEHLENIFKQFYQVKSGESDGVGLGLPIVKNIIEQHGGCINVTSKVGEGSAFTFTLPKEHHFNDLVGLIFDMVGSQEELNKMLTLAVRVIAEMLSVKIVSLMLIDQKKQELFIKVAYGLDEGVVERTRVKLGAGIAGKVAVTGEPLLIENIEEDAEGYENNPQYETKSLLSAPLKIGSTVIGVINVNNKTSGGPFDEDDLNLLMSLTERLSKVIERIRTSDDSSAFIAETINSLNSILESHRMSPSSLVRKLINWSVRVARKLHLTEKEVKVIQYVASVHDVGMTCVGEEILKKTLELTPEEIEEIRKHPQKGAAIMRPLEFVEMVSQNILFHHERMDGKGYPMGLKGEQIPIGSRIIAVIDAFVSMITEKPFRRKLSVGEAVEELINHAGTQFDPEVVRAFIEVLMDDGLVEVEEYTKISDMIRCSRKHHTVP